MCMIISGSLAIADTINTIQTTSIATTAVHIEIEDFTQDYSIEQNALLLMPGDSVSFVPKVVNYGTPCYVRAKIDVKIDGKSEDVGTQQKTSEHLTGSKQICGFAYFLLLCRSLIIDRNGLAHGLSHFFEKTRLKRKHFATF